jgi:hypothetical protein
VPTASSILDFTKHKRLSDYGYPQNAIAYLKTRLPAGQIFSTYDWGGYLIWKLPEKKVFIDGRMPSWRGRAHIAGESDYAFNDYLKLLTGRLSFESTVKKYNITTLLLPNQTYEKQSPLVELIENFTDDLGKKFNLLFLNKKLKSFSYLVTQAKKAGWLEIYKDNTTVIYHDKAPEILEQF